MFQDLKFNPHMLATVNGLKQILEKLGITLTKVEGDRLLRDVRNANYGKFECTYKDVIDFFTKKRINVAFLEKGFLDPLLAACVN